MESRLVSRHLMLAGPRRGLGMPSRPLGAAWGGRGRQSLLLQCPAARAGGVPAAVAAAHECQKAKTRVSRGSRPARSLRGAEGAAARVPSLRLGGGRCLLSKKAHDRALPCRRRRFALGWHAAARLSGSQHPQAAARGARQRCEAPGSQAATRGALVGRREERRGGSTRSVTRPSRGARHLSEHSFHCARAAASAVAPSR